MSELRATDVNGAAPKTVAIPATFSAALRGEPDSLRSWIENWNTLQLGRAALLIIAGSGIYGAAVGSWRGSVQSLFVALKLPLILVLTAMGNAILNAMIAPLLGLKATLLQTFRAILLSFMIAAAILGSLSPLVFFLVWTLPSQDQASATSKLTHSLILLLHVALVALSGIIANLRLSQLLLEICEDVKVTRRVLLAWLAGNLFLGSQISWILRPFIGSPELPIRFLRETAFQGNFYEAVFHSLIRVLNP
jgi:hypothetical protein